jgi:hypothetical protein
MEFVTLKLSAARWHQLMQTLKWGSEFYGSDGQQAWELYKELMLSQGVRIIEPPKPEPAKLPPYSERPQSKHLWFPW